MPLSLRGSSRRRTENVGVSSTGPADSSFSLAVIASYVKGYNTPIICKYVALRPATVYLVACVLNHSGHRVLLPLPQNPRPVPNKASFTFTPRPFFAVYLVPDE